jgi:nucleotide-binding universal stress UspA family protein
MVERILLASDGSEGAIRAAHFAADLVQKYGATLTLLHVFSSPVAVIPLTDTAEAQASRESAFDRYVEDTQRVVAHRTGRVLEECGVPYTLQQEIGHAAEVITRVAREGNYDLIVLGSRGLSEWQSFLMGSVSDRVSHHAPCSVLIVR